MLTQLGVIGSLDNAKAIIAQAQAEGGAAKFNPLNCTLKLPGSTDYNDVPVQNYTSYKQGLDATCQMLNQPNMATLLVQLKSGSSAPSYWLALAQSPWGTKPPGGMTINQWLQDVAKHWYSYAMEPIAGT